MVPQVSEAVYLPLSHSILFWALMAFRKPQSVLLQCQLVCPASLLSIKKRKKESNVITMKLHGKQI